jgi:hypothetical protein
MEVERRKQPMAELVREAVEAYLTREPAGGPPGAGAFSSGKSRTADDVDGALKETDFGEPRTPARRKGARPAGRRAVRRRA